MMQDILHVTGIDWEKLIEKLKPCLMMEAGVVDPAPKAVVCFLGITGSSVSVPV